MFPVKDDDMTVQLLRLQERAMEAAQSWGLGRQTTVDQALIRGLVTAFRVFVPGLSSV